MQVVKRNSRKSDYELQSKQNGITITMIRATAGEQSLVVPRLCVVQLPLWYSASI